MIHVSPVARLMHNYDMARKVERNADVSSSECFCFYNYVHLKLWMNAFSCVSFSPSV